MRFELTKALIDDILFSMEDQNGEFLLDTRAGMVSNTELDEFTDEPEEIEETEETEDGAETRFVSLPEWGPSEGFSLMERFTAGLEDQAIREALSAALDRSRGVFRAFKDAIARYPETETRWYDFKEREMRREIIRWYNGLREEWGLEPVDDEPGDTDGPA
jgi:hypothetical protein